MSRSRARYTQAVGAAREGELIVPVPEAYVLRAAERLRGQGTSGLARIGARVRALLRELGGYPGRGRPLSAMAERGLREAERGKKRKV